MGGARRRLGYRRPRQGRRACEKEARACPRDVYVYFDNDAKVRAPFDAMGLETKVRQKMGTAPAKGPSSDRS